MRILVDMDEVLADFAGSAAAVHGWTYDHLLDTKPKGQWDMIEPMGLTPDEFWEPIHKLGEKFWVDLKMHPWVTDLIHLVMSVTDDWYVVSCPSQSLAAYTGKIKWLRGIFGQDFNRFIITSHKHLLAQENVVLVDDREATVKKFIVAGGKGVVFPSPHNHLYELDNPVKYVKDWFLKYYSPLPALL